MSDETMPTRRRSDVAIPLAVAAVTFLLYLPTFRYGFVNYDDSVFVTQNPYVNRGLTRDGVLWAFEIHGPSQYHPLAWLSHMLDVELFGLNAGRHHAVNVLIHALSTVLLYRFLIIATKSTWPSAAVAALFGWHPTRVESVAWISERKDLLCGLFVILTLIAYARYARKPGVGRYAVVALAYAAALASKPMAVVLPALLLLLDYWPLERWPARGKMGMLVGEKVPLLLMAFGSLVLSYLAQLDAQAVVSLGEAPVGARLANAVVSTTRYLRMAVLPTHLAVFYPRQAWPAWQVLACAAILIAITAAVVRFRRPYALVGWGWFLISLAPVIGILQVGDQAMADRYTYLPFLGLFLLVVWTVRAAAGRSQRVRRSLPLAAAAAMVTLAGMTAAQVSHWRSDEALFRHATTVTRGNHVAHHLLGVALSEQGRMAEAVEQYVLAMRAGPRYVDPRVNLGILAQESGDLARAERLLGEARSIDPDHRKARFAMANVWMAQGRFDAAAFQFAALAQEDPQDVAAQVNLGAAREMLGDRVGAEAAYRAALRIDPGDPDATANLASLLAGGATQQHKAPSPPSPP